MAAWTLIVLTAVCWILGSTGSTAHTKCPVNCTCVAKVSTCKDVNYFSGPFPVDVVNITITDSTLKKLEPKIFGKQLENIFIESTTIKEIASYTFSSHPVLKSLRLHSVFITEMKPWSIHNITSPAVIEFRDCKIDRLESEAISRLQRLEKITIGHSAVDATDTKAFFDIKVREFVIFDTEITNMNTSSFDSIIDVETFHFSAVSFDSVKARAFTNIQNIRNVTIEGCTFRELHCNAIMELREATPGNHDNFVFSNSRLDCGCQVGPILDYARKNHNALKYSVWCTESVYRQVGKDYKPLSTYQIPKSCPEGDNTCESVKDLHPTYTTNADTNTAASIVQSAYVSSACSSIATCAMFTTFMWHIVLITFLI